MHCRRTDPQTNLRRRRLKAKRGENRFKGSLQNRIEVAFDTWMNSLLENEDELTMTQLLALRTLITDDSAALIFVEQNFCFYILQALRDMTDIQKQITILLATSELIDVDRTGIIGKCFSDIDMMKEVLLVMRQEQADSRLKTASICVLSSLCLHDAGALQQLEESEIQYLHELLQNPTLNNLQPRIISFLNNIYISGYFQDKISETIPTLIGLLTFNFKNHIKFIRKLEKTREADQEKRNSSELEVAKKEGKAERRTLMRSRSENDLLYEREMKSQLDSESFFVRERKKAPTAEGAEEPRKKKDQQRAAQLEEAEALSDTSQDKPDKEEDDFEDLFDDDEDDEVDPGYHENLYHFFTESAAYLLSNLTTVVDNCILAMNHHSIQILAFFLNHSDTSLLSLSSIVKCLGNLANLEDNHPQLLTRNILSNCVKLIKHPHIEDETRAQLTLFMANLSCYGDCGKVIIDEGVIEPILDVLDSGNEEYQRLATLALANLSVCMNSIPKITANPKVVKTLVDLCFSQNFHIPKQVCRVLHSIATYPTGLFWNCLKEAGAIDGLNHIIETFTEDEGAFSLRELAKITLTHLKGKTYMIIPPKNIKLAMDINELIQASTSKVSPNPAKALLEKNKGNEYFFSKNYKDAIISYTNALEHDPSNHTIYSNRAAAYMHLDQYQLALKDAEKCLNLVPEFVKAHFRRGKALLGLELFSEAVDALSLALKLKKNNREIREALQFALLRKKDRGNNPLPAHYHRLSILEILKELYNSDVYVNSLKPQFDYDQNYQPSPMVSNLLTHLFNHLKKCYSSEIDEYSHSVLLGVTDPSKIEQATESICMQIHNWSVEVDLNQLMLIPGIPKLLFETEYIANHIRETKTKEDEKEESGEFAIDLSCQQFGIFVCSILSRLVLQGHSKYGLRSLKRLILII
eukprot:TRINITY_DN15766_c0_g1_i3.p1 TRINITY_DN15766_c0_g1~~TRINITY_DN15766_c0_g1_i3.p1  ORF type:complete len:922 (-),score=214.55 TRINITY_DN15766_c0_g1_i3:938-3703(-)